VAKALKLRGMIIIEGFVDKEGNLKQTKIIDGIGYGCDQLVEKSLQKSKFNPALKKGVPVEVKIVLSFPFSYER
jgi:protein TonB